RVRLRLWRGRRGRGRGFRGCFRPEVVDRSSSAPIERDPALGEGRADVVGARAYQAVVGVLLEHVRRPSRYAADGEDGREEIDRNAERVVGRGRVEINVGV